MPKRFNDLVEERVSSTLIISEPFRIYVVEIAAPNFGFDDIETACLATYQIVKGHFFMDGNKRTANYVLLNCLKSLDYTYTGRPIDLARKIEEIAQSPSGEKEGIVRELSYYLKARLQKLDH